MIVIGIDNGISGGLVAIEKDGGRMVSKLPMPFKAARSGNEIDIASVCKWVHNVGANYALQFVVEEPGGSKSAVAARSMAGSFHSLRGMLETNCSRWERVTPQKWQKFMLPGCKAGDTKPRALSRVLELWPEETWLASKASRKPHEGLIDAALIAEYGRRMGF